MILIGDVQHGALIAAAAGAGFDPYRDRCISRITSGGDFLGGVIYTGYNGTVIWGHLAGIDGWMSAELLWVAFDYPFMQLKVKQILCTIGSQNTVMLDIARRLGFKPLYKIKDGVPNGGTLGLYSMSKANCRWLKLRERYVKLNGSGTGCETHAA